MIRALVTSAPGELSCIEVPRPEPRSGSVLIDFEVGLFTAGTLRSIRGNATQVVQGGFKYPLTIGGTALGRVMDAGGTKRFQKGDRVLVSNVIVCGSCVHCQRGADNLCVNRQLAGIHCDGTFSQVIRVEERRVFPVEESASNEMAALTTEVAVLVNALEMGWASTEKRDRVAVIGVGSLGIHAVWLARSFGAKEIHAVDPDPERQKLARTAGADVSMSPHEYDGWIAENPAERGASISLVTTDHPDAILLGCRSLLSRGCVVCVGLPQHDEGRIPRYYPNFMAKELTIRGCYAKSSHHIRKALELLDKRGSPHLDKYVEIDISHEGAQRLLELSKRWPDGKRYLVTHG